VSQRTMFSEDGASKRPTLAARPTNRHFTKAKVTRRSCVGLIGVEGAAWLGFRASWNGPKSRILDNTLDNSQQTHGLIMLYLFLYLLFKRRYSGSSFRAPQAGASVLLARQYVRKDAVASFYLLDEGQTRGAPAVWPSAIDPHHCSVSVVVPWFP
jgi:hypothetical protein